MSFLGLYVFHLDYSLASEKYYWISLKKSSSDIFKRKNNLGTEILNVTALFKSPSP